MSTLEDLKTQRQDLEKQIAEIDRQIANHPDKIKENIENGLKIFERLELQKLEHLPLSNFQKEAIVDETSDYRPDIQLNLTFEFDKLIN